MQLKDRIPQPAREADGRESCNVSFDKIDCCK